MSELKKRIYIRAFLVLLCPVLLLTGILAYKEIPYFSVNCFNISCYAINGVDFNNNDDEGRILVKLEKEYDSIRIPFATLNYLFIYERRFITNNETFRVIRPGDRELANELENIVGNIIRSSKNSIFFDSIDKLNGGLKELYDSGDIFICEGLEYTADLEKSHAFCKFKDYQFTLEIDTSEKIKDLHRSIIEELNSKEKRIVENFYLTIIFGPVLLIIFLAIIWLCNKAYRYVFSKD